MLQRCAVVCFVCISLSVIMFIISCCLAKTAKTISNSVKQKLYSSHVNFYLGNKWSWPSQNLDITLNWEQEGNKKIVTILKTRLISCSFLRLWTHLSWCLPVTGSLLLSVIVAGTLHTVDDCECSTCLWMSNWASESWLFTLGLV